MRDCRDSVMAEWKTYLLEQAALHPSMEPQDVYKLLFQAVYGAEHLLQDKTAAYAYFQKEYEAVWAEEELLYERIHADRYRVNLSAWKKRGLPAEWLFRMFAGSVEQQALQKTTGQDGRRQKEILQGTFREYTEIAKEAVKEGAFAFSDKDFSEYTEKYNETGPRAVHHSEQYRAAEKPAYRVVAGNYLRILPLLKKMAELQLSEESVPGQTAGVIAIDGRCASGKSTIAGILSEITGAGIIHMDDFFLPMELRTQERLSQPGGNVHYERFQAEVLPLLTDREEFSYRCFDCSKMQLEGSRSVPAGAFRIVEGAYSCHPVFGKYADLTVFSDVEEAEQLERIRGRDGEKMLVSFRERWIPMEETYFAAFHVKEKADLIL